MKLNPLFISLLLAVFSLSPLHSFSCTTMNASFTFNTSKSCGLPLKFTFSNNSTGSYSSNAFYQWIVDANTILQVTGKSSFDHVFTTPGAHKITLIGTDTAGCRDTFTFDTTLTTNSPGIIDQSKISNFAPYWQNCILLPNTPDTFGISFAVDDSAFNYRIEWDDGTSDTGALLTKSQSIYHKYNKLGTFELRFISKNGNCIDTIIGKVVNERQPVAGLIGPATGTNFGCVPLRVKFKNYSQNISSSTSFSWDMGDTTYTFPASTYRDSFYHTYYENHCDQTVSLFASNACGESSATWKPIHASDKDSAVIDLINPNNCDLTKPFIFQNKSDDRYCIFPDIKQFYWDFGDNTNTGWITSKGNQNHIYSQVGTYTIMLVNKNYCGVDTTYYILDIQSIPNPVIDATNITGCNPLTASFTDLTKGSITSRIWNFGDVKSGGKNTSTDSTTSHVFNNAGTYNVTLKVSNICGAQFDTTEIIVNDKIKAGFQTLKSGCFPVIQTFTNTSITSYTKATYLWDFGDNTSSTDKNPVTKTYSTPGTYTIKLIATDSCGTDSFIKTFEVFDYPVANFTTENSVVCHDQNINFTNSSTGANSFTWDFGDGTKVFTTSSKKTVHVFKNTGKYTIRMITKNPAGCNDSISKILTVLNTTKAAITTDVSNGCGPLNVQFNKGKNSQRSNGVKYLWDFRNGTTATTVSPKSTFQASKKMDSIYKVKFVLTANNGCMDSLISNITVYPNPIASYTADKNKGCSPLKINFKNKSVPNNNGDISIMSFNWFTGNGSSSNNKDLSTTYLESSSMDSLYSTKLIATSEHGCMDSITKNQIVYPTPTALFSADTLEGCSPLKIKFTNHSSPKDTGDISIMNFEWKLGKTDSSKNENVLKTFIASPSKDSSINISLIAYSEHNCKSEISKPITMYPKPLVNFDLSVLSGCSPLKVDFTDQSTNSNTQNWWLGKNNFTNTNDPNKTFIIKGMDDANIEIFHSVVSIRNCSSDTISKSILVYGQPVASFFPDQDSICKAGKVRLLNNSRNAVSHIWDMDKIIFSSNFNPVVNLQRSQNESSDTTYFPRLISESIKNCKDTALEPITVRGKNDVAITASITEGCSPVVVDFKSNKGITNTHWDFNDGTFSSLANLSHVFENKGSQTKIHPVTVYYNYDGCTNVKTFLITVHPETVANFIEDRINVCDSGIHEFNNYSKNAFTHLWRFSNGKTSTLANPTQTLRPSVNLDTIYSVNYSIVSEQGCKDSVTKDFTIVRKLHVDMLDADLKSCMYKEIQFFNKSKNVVKYIWDFGNGIGSTQPNPTLSFNMPGVFNYKLIGYDEYGCTDSVVSSKNLEVIEKPVAAFAYTTINPKLPNAKIAFKDLSISQKPLTYHWQLCQCTTGPVTSELKDPVVTYHEAGIKNIILTVSNGSCADVAIDSVNIQPELPLPNFEVLNNNTCAPGIITFKNTSQFADSFTWYFGDGKTSNEREPSHVYEFGGNYDVILVARGPGGINQIEKIKIVLISSSPFARFTLAPNVAYLPKAIFNIKNETTNSMEQKWDWTDTYGNLVGTSETFQPTIQIEDTGYYTIRLIAKSENGCTDTAVQKNGMLVNPRGHLFVPNSFTPNNDNLNDRFRPTFSNISLNGYRFTIIDRWGEVIFTTTDPHESWDGTFNNQICKQEVYAWHIKAKFIQGENIEQRGVVHLMR